MPAARGVKRAASKSSASTASTGPKNKKKRGAIQLDIPSAPKKRGRVLACGQGDVGQLGLGEDVIELTKFKYVTALGDKIVDVQAGGMHTIALDSSGKVWSFGCNDEGALGRAGDEARAALVALPAPAAALSAGDSHSAALTAAGDVYAWGAFRDSHGSMGLVVRGREGKPCREPVKVDIGEPAVGIASGGDHLVILSSSGAVYTMGCGEQGQLGRLSQRSASRDARQGFSALLSPARVALRAGAARVWAGYHATFALDANDKLYAWGLNNYGQLGITGEKRKTALFAPTECDAFNNIDARWQAVACGQHHSLAMDHAGQVYAVGRCEYGRLGLGDRSGDAEVPELIPKLSHTKCISIATGTSNSFAVADTGAVLAWGMGSEGQLGSGACADAAEPAPSPLPAHCRALRVAAGGQHTVLLVEEPSSQKEESPERAPAAEPMEAPPEPAREDSPEKVNGDEKIETPMEVDDTDAVKKTEQIQEQETDKSEAPEKMTDDETESTEPATEAKPDSDTSSQGTDDKSQDAPDTPNTPDTPITQDTPSTQDKLNGTPEPEIAEAKPLESIQQPLTTTA